jgi:hypothetical protein
LTTLPAYYASLGWKTIEETEYLGKLRAVMTFDLSGQTPNGITP